MSFHALNQAHKVWELTQKPMDSVTRFGNFPSYRQTLGQHQSSLPVTLAYVRSALAMQMPGLDWSLLARCCTFHDCGEPLTGGDEHIDNKTVDKDEREFRAFRKLLGTGDWYRPVMMAFMLQYVRRPLPAGVLFGDDAGLMSLLQLKYQREAAVFELVERMDYLMSALTGLEQGIKNDVEYLYDHVMVRQTPLLDKLVDEYPVLAQVWSPDLKHMLWSKVSDTVQQL